jgi:hypothetical protein
MDRDGWHHWFVLSAEWAAIGFLYGIVAMLGLVVILDNRRFYARHPRLNRRRRASVRLLLEMSADGTRMIWSRLRGRAVV